MRPSPRGFTSFLCSLSVVLAQDPGAADDPATREWIGGLPWSQWTRATGDWGGPRNELEAMGIEIAGGLTVDFASAWSGDVRRRLSTPSMLDFNAAFDLEALAGWARTIAYIDIYQIEGRDPTDDIGDAQGLSNLIGPDRRQIGELWIETWLDEHVRLKVGKVDFNSEFAFHEIGGEFVNSTAAVPPTIVGYPTYPDPATSVNVFYAPNERFYVGAAIYDGATADGFPTGSRGPSTFFSSNHSDSYFFAAEAGWSWIGDERWGSGRAVLGLFHHTADFERFAGGQDENTHGFWGSFEQHVWREDPTADDGQGVGVFVAFGLADEAVSFCGRSFAVGAEWVGCFEGRDHDILGFGIFHADLSDEVLAGTPADETALELLYKIQVTPALSLKPEFQYILNPGGQNGVDDVLVGLLRLEIQF